MFVTSDTIDLKRIGRFQKFDWQENLICSVDVHGTAWRGYEADAAFLLEAAKRCGVLGDMKYAGYHRRGDARTRSILPKSFERLARGELAGAATAEAVLFKGVREAAGAYGGKILFGGESNGDERRKRGPTGTRPVPNYPYKAFNVDFTFPLGENPVGKAAELLRLSVEIVGAEYGYFFVRDENCAPIQYSHGMGTGLDHSALNTAESDEIGRWGDFVREGRLWTETLRLFRDLFQINLLSERHLSASIEGFASLDEWIAAAPGRGRLEDAGQGRLLWILSDAEMVEVRPTLNEAGLLHTCRERVYRDLPQGAADAQRLYDAQKVFYAPWVSDAVRDYPGRFRG